MCISLLIVCISAFAQSDSSAVINNDTLKMKKDSATARVTWTNRTDSIASVYQKALMLVVAERNKSLLRTRKISSDVYSLRMMLPPTFYSSSVYQQFSVGDPAIYADSNLIRMYLVNNALAQMYVNSPGIVNKTDEQLKQSGTIRTDVNTSLTTETKLSDKVVNVDLSANVTQDVELVTRKPNFWKFTGSGSLQFTQNYFSDNWYQGGENNYAVLGLLTLNMNYDNKQNIQWENRLEAQLGFQTTGKSDTHHSMKPTNNLLRLTTKFGHKAYKTLYYTTQVQVQTQIVPQYESNSDNLISNFLSPLNLTVSVGMDYKFETKNKKFRGNVYLAPCSYNMRYVQKKELAGRYGIEENHHAYHNFGPSITVNCYWQIAKNVSWNSRAYWISNFNYTNIEWENTFNFDINRYMSAKLFVYPKFDDSSHGYKGEHGYLMMREWLSLGLNYKW